MLGSLARWLRMLGNSVVYDSKATDNVLLVSAIEGGMVLLTSDEELHRRAVARGVSCLLVSGASEEERLAQVAKAFRISLSVDMAATRCPECGGEIREASKLEVRGLVPRNSLRLYDEFWRCSTNGCGKVYWKGSHWKQINRTLAEASKLSSE